MPNQQRLVTELEPPRFDKAENQSEAPNVLEIPDAVTRKPLSRDGTALGNIIRVVPDLTFVWGAKTQPSVASEFFFFMSGRGISSST